MSPGERIKVLIVENFPQVAKRLEKLLSLIENVEILETVSNTLIATDVIRDEKPEVALIDINLPDMNGLTFAEKIRKEYPFTQVVVVAQDKYGESVLQAMRIGASDFITHDVGFEELNLSIQRAGESALSERRKYIPEGDLASGGSKGSASTKKTKSGKIITFYGPKGGSGTTMLAINLAIALQDSESLVAVVDANMQYGDVCVLLNEVPTFSVMDLIPRVNELDKKIIEDVMVLHKSSGLHVLAAPPRPEMAENVNGNSFTRVLEYLRQTFDYIVVNTSTYISEPCLSALDAGDVVVVVTTQEIAAIKNTRTFLDLWEVFNMSKDRLLLTLNRYEKQRSITPEKISERMKQPIPITILEDEETAYRSTSLGIPFMLSKKGLPIEKSIAYLAKSIQLKLKEVEAAGDRYRIFTMDALPY